MSKPIDQTHSREPGQPRRFRCFIVLIQLGFLLTAVRASGACPVSLTATTTPGSVLFTATVAGTCSSSTIEIKDEIGAVVAHRDCPTSSCTVTATRSTLCSFDGEHMIYAWGSCGKTVNGGC